MLMKKTMMLLAGVALFGSVNLANAQDFGRGIQLTTAQMEKVTAGKKVKVNVKCKGCDVIVIVSDKNNAAGTDEITIAPTGMLQH